MRLLLDTTYLLPAIGISIKGLSEGAPIELIRRGHQISISDVTIFELSAKGAEHIAIGALTAEGIQRHKGHRLRREDSEVPMHDSSVLLTAFKLRRALSDFMDCLILSSTINRSDVLVTEDEEVQNLRRKRGFRELLETINPRFRIQALADTL